MNKDGVSKAYQEISLVAQTTQAPHKEQDTITAIFRFIERHGTDGTTHSKVLYAALIDAVATTNTGNSNHIYYTDGATHCFLNYAITDLWYF